MSSEKRRKARTQGRFHNSNLDSKEKNGHSIANNQFSETQYNSPNLRSSERTRSKNESPITTNYNERCNTFQDEFVTNKIPSPNNKTIDKIQSHQFSPNVREFIDNSVDNSYSSNGICKASNDPKPKNESIGEIETTMSNCKLKDDDNATSSLDCFLPVDSTEKVNLFGKSMYTYEPTELENIVEKKVKRISEFGWHTLSTEPSGKSEIYFNQDFIDKDDQKRYFEYLNKYIKWELKEVVSHGTKYIQPRLVAWFGPFPYGYSGVILEANPVFPQIIQEIKNKIERLLRAQGRIVNFNSVLLNKYRDGKDGVAWHSDNELSMGISPLIASVSLGDTRRFELKRKPLENKEPNMDKNSTEIVLFLDSGSLVIMDGAMQHDWLHRIPIEFHNREVRINLTFRTVFPIDKKKIFQRSPR